jgi:hypothetical protein
MKETIIQTLWWIASALMGAALYMLWAKLIQAFPSTDCWWC